VAELMAMLRAHADVFVQEIFEAGHHTATPYRK